MFANSIKFDLLNHMMCTNLIPKFQKGMITQRDKKPLQSWEKKGPKIWHFWTPWAIW